MLRMGRSTVFLLLLYIGTCCIWDFSKAEPCPDAYRRFSTNHTFCMPPNLKCNIVKKLVSADNVRVILKEHNRYRNIIAMGQETVQKLPKAADMLQMDWDDELATVAQKHADQCRFEHDRNAQRMTKNFEAGQNLYIKYGTGPVLKPAWRAAVKAWYDEIKDFEKSIIPSYDTRQSHGVTGHFTQAIWAKSWKIGCGYSVFKEDGFNKELYVCNYGPAGNMIENEMYKIGDTCSACPINSCCGATCPQTEYPGLCKITDNRGPQYRNTAQEKALFFCNFQPETLCPFKASPASWQISHTLSGSYIGIVLKGGESATLNLTKTFKSDKACCLSINYRKGASIAGQESAHTATEHFLILDSGTDIQMALNTDSVGFYQFGMNLNWENVEYVVYLTFSVPVGKPAQYFELQDFTFSEGSC